MGDLDKEITVEQRKVAMKHIDNFLDSLRMWKVSENCDSDKKVLKTLNVMIREIMTIKEAWCKAVENSEHGNSAREDIVFMRDLDKKITTCFSDFPSELLLPLKHIKKFKGLVTQDIAKIERDIKRTVLFNNSPIKIIHNSPQPNQKQEISINFITSPDMKEDKKEKIRNFLKANAKISGKLDSSPYEDYAHLLPLNDLEFIKALRHHTKYIDITGEKHPFYCVKCDVALQSNYVVRHVRSNQHKKSNGHRRLWPEEIESEFKNTSNTRIIVRIGEQEMQHIKEPSVVFRCRLCPNMIMYTKYVVLHHIQLDGHIQKTISKCKPM